MSKDQIEQCRGAHLHQPLPLLLHFPLPLPTPTSTPTSTPTPTPTSTSTSTYLIIGMTMMPVSGTITAMIITEKSTLQKHTAIAMSADLLRSREVE